MIITYTITKHTPLGGGAIFFNRLEGESVGMVIEVTVQVRASDFEKGFNWYRTLLRREPEYAPHDGFAEWELIPGSWLQVAEGAPTEGNGPLRL